MTPYRHRGRRAARRADRRRRNWMIAGIVGAVLVVALGGIAAAAMLGGDSDHEAAGPTTTGPSTPTATRIATASTTTPVATLPCRAPLHPDAPLRLWIAGDSIAHTVGTGLGKRAAATGVVAPVYESRVSSGLASPGFFDWPKRLGEELPRLDPEVVVFVMGTNDWALPQPTPVDATGQPAWTASYRRQVEQVVERLTADGRTLYWVGPPVLRDSKQEAGAREVATVIREVVEANPSAEFVDAHDLVDADDGSYTAHAEVGGKRVQIRSGDGVHFTTEGADFLGDALFALLDAQCRLSEQAVPGARQPLVETKGSTSVPPGATATAPPLATSPPTSPPTVPPTTPTTEPPASPTTTGTTPSSPDTTPPSAPSQTPN